MAPDMARAGPVRSSEGVRVTAIPARAGSGNLVRVTGIPIQSPDSIEGSGVVLLSGAFRATAIPGDRPCPAISPTIRFDESTNRRRVFVFRWGSAHPQPRPHEVSRDRDSRRRRTDEARCSSASEQPRVSGRRRFGVACRRGRSAAAEVGRSRRSGVRVTAIPATGIDSLEGSPAGHACGAKPALGMDADSRDRNSRQRQASTTTCRAVAASPPYPAAPSFFCLAPRALWITRGWDRRLLSTNKSIKESRDRAL